MPWNDLYRMGRKLRPGAAYPPVCVGSRVWGVRVEKELCGTDDRRFFSTGWLSALPFVLRLLHRRDPARVGGTIVHIHNPSLSAFAPLVRWLGSDVRIVFNQHNDGSRYSWLQRALARLAFRFSDHVVVVSEYLVETVPLRWRRMLEKRGAVTGIPNGVDPEMIHRVGAGAAPSLRREQAPGTGTAVVVARFVPQKNWPFLLRLVAELPELTRVTWFGQGPEMHGAKALAVELGISPRMDFRGTRPRDEVFSAIARADVYLAASRWEGIGVANLEAAALGCMPFLSRIGPHDEIARAIGVRTLSLDEREEWVLAIRSFLAQPAEARDAQASRVSELALQSFDMSKSVARYFDVYDSLPHARRA